MSTWDIDYHKNKLRQESGLDWEPVAETLEMAEAATTLAEMKERVCRSTLVLTNLVIFGSIALIIGGIVSGITSVFTTDGPVVAMILPTLFLGGGAGWLRFWLAVHILPPIKLSAISQRTKYRAALAREVGGV